MKARYKYPGQLVGAVKLRWPKWRPETAVPSDMSFWCLSLDTKYGGSKITLPVIVGEHKLLRVIGELMIYQLWPRAEIVVPPNQYKIEQLSHEKIKQLGLL